VAATGRQASSRCTSSARAARPEAPPGSAEPVRDRRFYGESGAPPILRRARRSVPLAVAAGPLPPPGLRAPGLRTSRARQHVRGFPRQRALAPARRRPGAAAVRLLGDRPPRVLTRLPSWSAKRSGRRTPSPRGLGSGSRCVHLEPDDPRLLLQLWRAQLRAADLAGASETRRALAHPKLSQPLARRSSPSRGRGVAHRPTRARRAPATRRRARSCSRSRRSGRWSPGCGPWTMPVAGRAAPGCWRTGTPGRNDALPAGLDSRERGEGLPPYLVAKQQQNRAEWAECALLRARGPLRKLPALCSGTRPSGMLGLRLLAPRGHRLRARPAFSLLGQDAPPAAPSILPLAPTPHALIRAKTSSRRARRARRGAFGLDARSGTGARFEENQNSSAVSASSA